MIRFRHPRPFWTVVLLPTLSSCAGWQSAMDPHGPQARHLASLVWSFSVLLGAIWFAVVAALVFALAKRRRDDGSAGPLATDAPSEARHAKIVASLAVATTVVVLALTALSFASQQSLFAPKRQKYVVQVTGHQWWWEVRYKDTAADRVFTTANEIHIPVGEAVKIELGSPDVIHSFWVPSLNGKQDLIPGQQNETELLASRPGVYRGQCAEFCGLQHAHMAFLVVAQDQADFERWANGQIAAAATPVGPEQQQGQAVFLNHACVMCHQIRGTTAGGQVGPDLTHVGSRLTVAAGELPLTRGSLAAWIADPQGVKPGNRMPMVPLGSDELNAVSAYLEGLK
jgi:cytochrome c oxidase subunit 2